MLQPVALSKQIPVFLIACVGLGVALVTGCSNRTDKNVHGTSGVLRLATTTSTRDSGLLEQLLPVFEKQHNCRVDVIAVGTGAALKLGEAGDADVVLVHARTAEQAFMDASLGTRHEEFMYNDFLILGPESDPAQIRGLDAVAALRTIAQGKHKLSRHAEQIQSHNRRERTTPHQGTRSLPPNQGHQERNNHDVQPGNKAGFARCRVFEAGLLQRRSRDEDQARQHAAVPQRARWPCRFAGLCSTCGKRTL